ncbi:hypothetical protein [Endozoicomonas ascidiicola]|uniref:hypothetical protein n=1 Tax=Endozoicomonas ascidiicola TaxID=1698521 RepID=UPI000834B8E9|nr:hypothetical protein [Endozoicomonas ascidiicola]
MANEIPKKTVDNVFTTDAMIGACSSATRNRNANMNGSKLAPVSIKNTDRLGDVDSSPSKKNTPVHKRLAVNFQGLALVDKQNRALADVTTLIQSIKRQFPEGELPSVRQCVLDWNGRDVTSTYSAINLELSFSLSACRNPRENETANDTSFIDSLISSGVLIPVDQPERHRGKKGPEYQHFTHVKLSAEDLVILKLKLPELCHDQTPPAWISSVYHKCPKQTFNDECSDSSPTDTVIEETDKQSFEISDLSTQLQKDNYLDNTFKFLFSSQRKETDTTKAGTLEILNNFLKRPSKYLLRYSFRDSTNQIEPKTQTFIIETSPFHRVFAFSDVPSLLDNDITRFDSAKTLITTIFDNSFDDTQESFELHITKNE